MGRTEGHSNIIFAPKYSVFIEETTFSRQLNEPDILVHGITNANVFYFIAVHIKFSIRYTILVKYDIISSC